jgi:hypothetical protein
MSRTPTARWAAALALGLTACIARAADPPAPADGAGAKRLLVIVKHRPAKEVADLLGPLFKDAAEFRTIPDSPVNALLIRAAPAAFDDAVKAVERLDRPRRTAAVEVWIVETPPPKDGDRPAAAVNPRDLAGPTAEVAARLDDLHDKGVLSDVMRVRLSCVEGRQESVLAGGARAFTVGAFAVPGGPVARTIVYRDLGSQVRATVAVSPDDQVTVDLQFQDARPDVAEGGPPVGNDEKGKPITATGFLLTRWEGVVTVPSGRTRVAADAALGSGRGRLFIIVGARVVEPDGKAEK